MIKNSKEKGGFFKDINWIPNILELFEELKKIKQDIWLKIYYYVFLDKNDNVLGIEFRITPEGSTYHDYVSVHFDTEGKIINDLKGEVEEYNNQDNEDDIQFNFKVVKKIYKTLINLQNKQKYN